MSMLDRYRKPGGFYQLLALVETCGQAKQAKFMELIRAEDTAWADCLRTKMLDINRIYSWNDDTFSEVIGSLQDLTVATALHGGTKEIRNRIYATLSQGRRRKIDELFERSVPSASEVAGQQMKIVQTVRKMAQDGILRFERFDPQLYIDDKLEEQLGRASANEPVNEGTVTDFKIQYEPSAEQPASSSEPTAAPLKNQQAPDALSERRAAELQLLKKKLLDLNKENTTLRNEITLLKSKLEQIKRIA